MTLRTITFTAQTPSVGVPSWYTGLTSGVWSAIPGINTKASVQTSTVVPGGFNFSVVAWNGGSVDQARGEFLAVANGGHANYMGNEAYACLIRSESPQWYRLSEPSPQSALDAANIGVNGTFSTGNLKTTQGHEPRGYPGMFGDGRSRSMHDAGVACYANGKVWFIHQSSVTGIGYSTPHAWSWNRTHTNTGNGRVMPTAPGQPAQEWENNAGPWTWLGPTSGEGTGYTHPAAWSGTNYQGTGFDPVTNLVWFIQDGNFTRYASLNTLTGQIISTSNGPGTVQSNASGGNCGWGCVCYDPTGADRWRLYVTAFPMSNKLGVLNLKANPYLWSSWSYPSCSQTVPGHTGGQYHPASKAILSGDPIYGTGRNLVKISVPVDGTGNYVPSATWQLETITVSAGADPSTGMNTNSGEGRAFNKWNIINMNTAGTEKALIFFGTATTPVYIFPLPSLGI